MHLRILILAILAIHTTHAYSQTVVMLDSAIHHAIQYNSKIQIEEYEYKKAQLAFKESKSLYRPEISLNSSYNRYFDKQVIFMPGSFVGNNSAPVADVAVGGLNTFSTYANFVQSLINIPAIHQIKQARITRENAKLGTEYLKQQVAKDIYTRYFTIALYNKQLGLLKNSLSRNIKALSDSKLLYYQGKALKTDTLNYHIVVQNVIIAITALENELIHHTNELQRLCGFNLSEKMLFSDTQSINRPLLSRELMEDTAPNITGRYDIEIQRKNVSLATTQLKQAQSYRLPKLSVLGQYQLQAQADNLTNDRYNLPATSFIGVQLSIPIYEGNKLNNKNKSKKYTVAQELIVLDNMTNEARVNLKHAQNKLQEAIWQKSIVKNKVVAAEANYEIINNRYSKGLASRLELTDAELSLSKEKIALVTSEYNIRVAEVQLLFESGKIIR